MFLSYKVTDHATICATIDVLLLVHYTNLQSACQPLDGLLRFFLGNILGHLGNLFLFAPFPRSAITYDNRAILRCSTGSGVFPQPYLHQFCVFSHDFWWSR